jgi:hydrogenase nickel incorporation protein HypA/HybF
MHELSLAQNIISIIEEQMRDRPSSRVKAVYLQVGKMSNVLVDSLIFGFDTLIGGTAFQGARLVIEEPPVIVRCRSCSAESQIEHFNFCCANCGGVDVEIIGGTELFVTSIEIEENGRLE